MEQPEFNQERFDSFKTDLHAVSREFGSAQASYTSGIGGRTFSGYNGHISVRSETTREDYDAFRPSERVPTDPHDAMDMCMTAYNKVGIVYHTINLLADFVTAGIRLEHKTPSKQRLFRKWWKKVKGDFVSERLINYTLRCGNAIGHRTYSKVPVSVVKEFSSKSNVYPETVIRRIPTDYTFINPLSVNVIGKELSTFVKNPVYVLEIDQFVRSLYMDLSNVAVDDKDALVRELLQQVPKEIRTAINEGARYCVLPQEDLFVYHYKKDDWMPIAYPMAYPVLDNILDLEKMHLADRSALDGAISNIRLWRLGYIDTKNPANSVIPKKAAYQKLRDTLENNVMGGVIDIIWGPELDFKESTTSVHQFLGSEKYTQIMYEIYEGLGIPPTLTGRGGGGSSFNNNYLSMKAMTSTLQYLRNILVDFWEGEIKIVAEALNISPAQIQFENINFNDENVVNKLLLDLIDRDLISSETVLEHFDFLPDIQKKRVITEQKLRQQGKIPDKAGPYHNPQTEHDLKKLALQRGTVTPSEVGLELEDKKDGEKSFMELQGEMQEKQAKLGGQMTKTTGPEGTKGRPSGSKDTKKRLPKNTLVTSTLWGVEAQNKINDIILPLVLKEYAVANCRQLTSEQKALFEKAKLCVFAEMLPMTEVTQESVYKILSENPGVSEGLNEFITESFLEYTADRGMPSTDELKYINASAHAHYYYQGD